MDFNWRSPLVTRLAILLVSMVLFAFLLRTANQNILLLVGVTVAIVFQVRKLAMIMETAMPEPTEADPPVLFDEVTQTFKTNSNQPGKIKNCKDWNDMLLKYKTPKKEKDSEHQFFKNIVQHAPIGLLTFKKDRTIQIINSEAKRLLRIQRAEKLDDLLEVSPELIENFTILKTGGRELVRIRFGDESIQLSIYVIELTLRDEVVKLVAMSNIQSELEEKEMEAWQNLVRVLTHEIMNSVTPISSLAGIVEEDLKSRIDQGTESVIKKDELDDMYLSLQTISKRSEGLIKFVKEFRNLTHIPKPKLAEISVKELLEELAQLHKKELSDHTITIDIKVEPVHLVLTADKTMIEQVLINLIKNAIQSFDEQSDRQIKLSGYLNENNRPVISVKDTGAGIDEEAQEKIFIPFFSTKKTGSGIGLSLSKQIMRQHEGTITVKSKLGVGTEFLLRF